MIRSKSSFEELTVAGKSPTIRLRSMRPSKSQRFREEPTQKRSCRFEAPQGDADNESLTSRTGDAADTCKKGASITADRVILRPLGITAALTKQMEKSSKTP